MQNFGIANLLIDFKSINDRQLSIRFNSFKQIEDACLNMYLGCAIFELGYIYRIRIVSEMLLRSTYFILRLDEQMEF